MIEQMFTLILPQFLRHPDERVPPLHTPILNQLLRFANFQAASCSRLQLYQTHLCHELALPDNSAYASPISQQMGMNHVLVQSGRVLNIQAQEAKSWCEGLNQLYENEWYFTPIRPDLWRVDGREPIDWQMESVLDLPAHLQPQHASADYLQLSSETQMYLHNHALNQNRKPFPINGLWFWRTQPETPILPYTQIASNSDWRVHSSLPVHDLPDNWVDWQEYCQQNQIEMEQTAWFDERFVWAQATEEYVDTLAQWDRQVMTPIQAALQSGSLKKLKLICEAGELTILPANVWTFWKRPVIFDGKKFN